MKLSVVIVSYNEKQYIREAFESCMSQTFQDFEIIVGDDGSTDGSHEILAEYAKKYPEKFRYFVMDREPGEIILASYRVSNVLKRGIAMAKGEYILCLSGDDFYHDNTIFASQVAILDADDKKKLSACVSNYRFYWNDGTEEKAVYIPYSNSLSWSGGYVHISCFMFRKSVFDEGYFLDHFCDDTGLAYSLATAGKWKYLNTAAFSYRQRDKSIMHEADILELKLLEVMLFQDVLPKKKMYVQSLSRFYGQVRYVYKHRAELQNDRYYKFRAKTKDYEHDIIGMLADYDNVPVGKKIKFFFDMRKAQFFAVHFFFFRVLMRLRYRKANK